jgi:hypothetical protein
MTKQSDLCRTLSSREPGWTVQFSKKPDDVTSGEPDNFLKYAALASAIIRLWLDVLIPTAIVAEPWGKPIRTVSFRTRREQRRFLRQWGGVPLSAPLLPGRPLPWSLPPPPDDRANSDRNRNSRHAGLPAGTARDAGDPVSQAKEPAFDEGLFLGRSSRDITGLRVIGVAKEPEPPRARLLSSDEALRPALPVWRRKTE